MEWKSFTLWFRLISPVLRDWAPTFGPLDGTAKMFSTGSASQVNV
jgi:hypothetical protein